MPLNGRSIWQRGGQAFRSIRTGIVLLILVGVASAVGTLVLQRPQTDPEKLAAVYTSETLRWLDRLGLTDVFHSWWFAALLGLLGVNLVLTSLERFPVAWNYFRRPYRQPGAHFLKGLTLQKELAVPSAAVGVEAAESAFRRLGFKPRRVQSSGSVSLYAERNRFSRLAAYVVHASLLLIFGGAIADALWGYRGFVALTPNQPTNQIELSNGKTRALPFVIRCDAADQENYPDGSPRRWWSKLAVLENGREVQRKEIAVNDPLVYRGVRFYQSSYGSSGEVSAITLRATLKSDPGNAKEITLRPTDTLPLDAETSVSLAAFCPDFVLRGKEVDTRSSQPNNPAIQLLVDSKKSGAAKVWLFPNFPSFAHPDASPYAFQLRDLEMGYFTGVQVSHEPGQWAVWAGVVLMGLGLAAAFYFIHVRVWAVPVSDDRGRLMLWVGASASKNREEFEERFQKLVEEIASRLAAASEARASERDARLALRESGPLAVAEAKTRG